MMRIASLVLVSLFFTTPVCAREAILSFNSDVKVEADASLTVTETIVVNAEGREIRRGIVREFPTTYKDELGHRYKVAFEVESVKRNGVPEPWFTKKRINGIELYIGEESKLLSPGRHSFEITYSTDRQIAYYEDFDELYWSVTGNGWRLPIDAVSYSLHLPGHANALRIAGYTGYYGSNGSSYEVLDDTSGLVRVASTRPFAREEGLSVAVSFPSGLVFKPAAMDRTLLFFRDNVGAFVGLIGLLVIFGFYLYNWDRRGRDPEGSAIIPRFKPPGGFFSGGGAVCLPDVL